ncbi:MAG: alginate export family protein [Candidatus Wallbacteria bacterium]|nr:alginate export family protein [Candidatus Wallbacteria bacterium]
MRDTRATIARSVLALALGLMFALPAYAGGALEAAAGAAPAADTSSLRRTNELLLPREFDVGWHGVERRNKVDFQVGGWAGLTMASFRNDDNDRNTADAVTSLLLSDMRLWSRVWLRDGTNAYVRLRAIGYEFGVSPGVLSPQLPNDGLDLDLGYVDSKLLGASYRIGRQYIRYGSGLVLANTLDAVRTFRQHGNFGLNAFIGKNKPRELDLDPNIAHPHRIFSGLDLTYQRADDSKLFGYILAERDKSGQPTGISVAGQGFHYDANYAGLGLDGRFSPQVDYHAEAIYERGDSFAIGSGTATNNIGAWAGIGSLAYHEDRPMHPVYTAEVLKGSGDSGRLPGLGSVSANAPGRDDGNFLGFGRYDLGIALNPRLSNLRVLRLGGTMKPWEEHPGFEELALGGKLSFYRKDDPSGGISDPQATLIAGDIGTGLDLFCGWRIYSDLSWNLQYGIFNPGTAYPAATHDSTRTLYSNVTWSF